MRVGFDSASGDYLVTIDFDLSYDPQHIIEMVNELDSDPDLDAVLASCYMPGGKTEGVSWFRLLISRAANWLYGYAYNPKVYTSTCIVRAYRSDVIKSILLESDSKEIHVEILSKLFANGFTIKEIPAILRRRKAGRSKFFFKSQAITHLIYFVQEKPFALFGAIGAVMIIFGFFAIGVLLYTRFGGNEAFQQTVLSRIISPNFVIILVLSGLQMIGLGFLGIQNTILKKELFKIQRQIKKASK